MGFKARLKRSKFIMRCYNKLLPYYCRFFTKSAVKMLYKQTFQKPLDLKNPRDLNEKINWLKVYKYKKDPLVIQCADKYRMREYVKNCGCEELLNELYGVYYNYKEIDIKAFPEQFVLKLNRGAGMNYICLDKTQVDEKSLSTMAKKWFHNECGERYGELHYRKARPCIICEKYLGDEAGNYPIDYKVYTFNGKVHMVELCLDRKDKVKFLHVDSNYNKLVYTCESESEDLPVKPDCFEKIIEYAEKLSKPFCHVRIDFYVYNGMPLVGELTFTSCGGFDTYLNQQALDVMGDLLVLPKK